MTVWDEIDQKLNAHKAEMEGTVNGIKELGGKWVRVKAHDTGQWSCTVTLGTEKQEFKAKNGAELLAEVKRFEKRRIERSQQKSA